MNEGKWQEQSSIDILLDLEESLEKEGIYQVLSTYSKLESTLFRITKLPLSIRILHCLANLNLEILMSYPRLLERI